MEFTNILETMKPTEKTIKALQIIDEMKVVTARSFAETMWPDSYMHKKTSNQGNGACRGKAGWLCGGSYIGKLIKAGLVRHTIFEKRYSLTDEGRKILDNEIQKHGQSTA